MEKEKTKAFRKYMENAVNRLCYDAMADAKKHSGRVIDEVMAFAIIDALAKAPDWNFGELEDIGDCDTRQINVSDEQGNILWED